MAEFLKPDEIDESLSMNPYIRALQAANRLGLMGIRIENIKRTFPLGATDLTCAMMDIEQTEVSDSTSRQHNLTEGEING